MSAKKIPSVEDVSSLWGKCVLLRASLNVPLQGGEVTNTFRLEHILPTINFLKERKAKVILIGHIGREKTETLEPVVRALNEFLPVKWCGDLVGEESKKAVLKLEDGEVLLLENVRSDEREELNDETFAKELASLADIYVNDAFSDSHREHTSICAVAKLLPSYFGFNFINEFEELNKAMTPEDPSLFILGGAKFETKIPLVDKYAKEYNEVFIGGALANDIFKAKGFEIGGSLVSDVNLKENGVLSENNLLLPVDVVVDGREGSRVSKPDAVKNDEKIMDAGPETIAMLKPKINKAKTILWNGPLGNYEHGFNKQTEELATLIADSEAFSVVGGGDTIAAIEKLGIQDKFGFMSTAGGAMLTFLETGTLVGIESILNKNE
jgi:phosphoglycerate kinase